jgi:hypothetical protein
VADRPSERAGFVASGTKDSLYVESGRRGAEKRWSDPASRKIVRIDSLSTEERAVVLALIDAKKAAPFANGAAQEVDDVSAITANARRS